MGGGVSFKGGGLFFKRVGFLSKGRAFFQGRGRSFRDGGAPDWLSFLAKNEWKKMSV